MKKIKHLSIVLILVFTLILAGCATTPVTPANAGLITTTEPAAADIVKDAAKAYFAKMPADIYKIPEKDFVDKIKANEDMFIMDIRQAADYDKGHVKDAVNIPWGESIANNLASLPKDKVIMVYCYTGQTAGQTVALLNVSGFNAKSVNLGWNLGISKVEGVNEVTETKANPIPQAKEQIDPQIQTAITNYFSKMAELKGTTYANFKISEDDAKKAFDAKLTNVKFLSVRKGEDFNKGHIAGAINLPFSKGMQAYFDLLLQKNKKVIVYCYTGQTAGQTVAILRLLGYDAVSLNSGMGTPATPGSGWANKGFPVEGSTGHALKPSPGDHS